MNSFFNSNLSSKVVFHITCHFIFYFLYQKMLGFIDFSLKDSCNPIESLNISIECKVCNDVLEMNVKQQFVNNQTESIEIDYVIPYYIKYCITKLIFEIGDMKIVPIIRPKDEAKEIYKQGIEESLNAVYSDFNEDHFLHFKLGNIKGYETFGISFSFVSFVNNSSLFYSFIIPLIEQKNVSYANCSFSLNINVMNQNEIDKILINIPGEFKRINANNLIFNTDTFFSPLEKVECTVYIKNQPKSTCFYSQCCYCLSVYPPSTENSVQKSKDEFLFLIDTSGSMSGLRIENVLKCMKIFLKSLEIGCNFSIWTFNAEPKCIVSSREYNQTNLNFAMNSLKECEKCSKTTDLLLALQAILENPLQKDCMRNLFILTDGEVEDMPNIIKLADMNKETNKMFTIGLGTGADQNFLSYLSHLTRASSFNAYESSNILNNEAELAENVINMLRSCNCLYNLSVILESSTSFHLTQTNNNNQLIYENFNHLFIKMDKKDEKRDQFVFVTASNKNEKYEETIPVIDYTFGGETLEKFAAFNEICNLQQNQAHEEDPSIINKIIELSIKYNILSDYTAYVNINTMKTEKSRATININGKIYPVSSYQKVGSGKHGHPKIHISYKNTETGEDETIVIPKLMQDKYSLTDQKKQMKEDEITKEEQEMLNIINQCVNDQSFNGRWEEIPSLFPKTYINPELESKFGLDFAINIAIVVLLLTKSGKMMNSLILIIKKAKLYLKEVILTNHIDINLDEIIEKEKQRFQ